MHNKLSEKNKRDIVSALGLVTQLGISMAAAIFIGIFIGSFLDKTFNTSPVLLLIFTVIGIGAAFINLYKLTIDFYQKKADNIKDEKGGH